MDAEDRWRHDRIKISLAGASHNTDFAASYCVTGFFYSTMVLWHKIGLNHTLHEQVTISVIAPLPRN